MALKKGEITTDAGPDQLRLARDPARRHARHAAAAVRPGEGAGSARSCRQRSWTRTIPTSLLKTAKVEREALTAPRSGRRRRGAVPRRLRRGRRALLRRPGRLAPAAPRVPLSSSTGDAERARLRRASSPLPRRRPRSSVFCRDAARHLGAQRRAAARPPRRASVPTACPVRTTVSPPGARAAGAACAAASGQCKPACRSRSMHAPVARLGEEPGTLRGHDRPDVRHFLQLPRHCGPQRRRAAEMRGQRPCRGLADVAECQARTGTAAASCAGCARWPSTRFCADFSPMRSQPGELRRVERVQVGRRAHQLALDQLVDAACRPGRRCPGPARLAKCRSASLRCARQAQRAGAARDRLALRARPRRTADRAVRRQRRTRAHRAGALGHHARRPPGSRRRRAARSRCRRCARPCARSRPCCAASRCSR